MAKVRRYSGQLKIELSYNDRADQYRVKLCPVVKREACETVFVKPPRHLTHGVDSPIAYDRTAQAAISFAKERIQNFADSGDRDWDVRRPDRVKRSTVRSKRRAGLSGFARGRKPRKR